MASGRSAPVPAYLGEFEQLVLLAVMKLDDRATGEAIRSAIADSSKRLVWIGAVHTTLERLEAKRLVRSRVVPGAIPNGRRRKTYASLPAGQAAIGHAYLTWVRMTQGLKPKLESSL